MTLVTVKNSSAKAQYQYIIIKGQFIDSLQRRKFSTQSLEYSHHSSYVLHHII